MRRMNPHGLASLELVQRFLESQVLSVIPNEMRGDLRAAIKILREVSVELDVLYPMLLEEVRKLLLFCAELQAAPVINMSHSDQQQLGVLDDAFKKGFASVTELLSFRDELNTLVTTLMTLLQAAEHPDNLAWLARFYELLGEHAGARLRWQSVF
jgi:hypothetical protein